MPSRKGREDVAVALAPEEWAEIRRIAGEIMDAVMAGSIAHDSGQRSIRRHIEMVLARNVTAAQRAYEAQAAAEEIHDFPPSEDTYQFPAHPVSECRPDFCGRYAGQRRDSAESVARKAQALEDFSRYGCLEPPPAPAGPAAHCARCARSGVGVCDDYPNCPAGRR